MTSLDFGTTVLGGNVFGWTADRETSFEILDAFVASGGISIDTADSYSRWVAGNEGGESEAIIGDWLTRRGRRDDVVIATKVFSHPKRSGLSPDNVRAAIDDSLRRLQTDYVDLYYAHRDDKDVSQEEYVGVLHELVQLGKVREIGASNFTPDRLRSAMKIIQQEGLTPFTVAQDQWNLVERGIEQGYAATLEELGLIELPYYSLASGFLSGKYRPGSDTSSARAGTAASYLQNPSDVALLSVLDDIAHAHSASVAAVSLAWLRSRSIVAAPIASASRVDQVAGLLEVVELTDDELAALSA